MGASGVLACLMIVGVAQADVVDLRTVGSEGTINGAIFQQLDTQPTGTGVIDSFVRLNGNSGAVAGYNTEVSNVFDNMSDATHNHAIRLADIPLVEIEGVFYRQFLLDVNENGRDPDIALNEVQVFQSDTPNQSTTTLSGGIVALSDSDLVYQMDAGGDNQVLLDYSLNSGSGAGDMFLYIADDAFSFDGEYVYLYSEFGIDPPEEAGFEEWAIIVSPTQEAVPEPSTFLLLGIGLVGILSRKRIFV